MGAYEGQDVASCHNLAFVCTCSSPELTDWYNLLKLGNECRI